jgi:glycosyltransferase involved in cell wall biosynthesis
MGDTPLFSVIIPWHGNEADLARAVSSLDAQTFRNFETVVICNGPGVDKLGEVMRDPLYSGCHFRIGTEPDANRARNLGIDRARGQWLAFLDCDDTFEPRKLERMKKAIEASPETDIWLSRGYRVRGPFLRGIYPAQPLANEENIAEFFFSRGSNCSVTAIVARAATARAVGFPTVRLGPDDPDFLIRAQALPARIGMVPEPLYNWNDDRAEGRISRSRNLGAYRQWARNMRPLMGDRAYFAFLARRVAQHEFPGRFWSSLADLWRGWRRGGIPLSQTSLFLLRGLLPASLIQALLDMRTRRESHKAEIRAARDLLRP